MVAGRLVVLGCICGVLPAAAQRNATLYGHVLDPSNGGVTGALITVVNEDTGTRRTAESQPDGLYTLGSLEPGPYKVTARKEGFRTLVRFGVMVRAASSTPADFVLPVGSMLETITVQDVVTPLDRVDASTGEQFDFRDIQNLPLNGAGLLGLLGAVPGTNVTPATRGEAGQFTADGQRPNTNAFTVDGVSANTGVTAGGLPAQSTGGTLPAVTAFGSLDALISPGAVEEMDVRTSSATVEFGRLPGAHISISSQSGANQWHGGAGYRWRNQDLGANDWFANQAALARPSMRLDGESGWLGGPVRRDRTFFFLDYQRLGLLQPFVWNQAVPTEAARQSVDAWAQPVVNLFGVPNGAAFTQGLAQWTGITTQPASMNAGSARIDEALTARVNLFGRYHDTDSANAFGTPEVDQLGLRSRSLTVGLTATPSSRSTLDVRVNESDSTVDSLWSSAADRSAPSCDLASLTAEFLTAPVGCDYLVRFTLAGVGQLVSGREGERRQRQFEAVGTFGLHRARHQLQWGADLRRITALRRDPTGTLAVLAGSLADLSDSNNLWIASSGAQRDQAEVSELSLWIGDTWQALPRLTVTMGLRWEFSPPPTGVVYIFDPAEGTVPTLPSSQPLWPQRVGNFAPRLGLAWRMTADGKTVLRAGGGLYYDSSMSIAADALNGGPLSISSFTSAQNAPFSSALYYAFLPNLHLPLVTQWNLTVERALSGHDVISAGYVGAAGSDLIRREMGGAGYTPTSWLALTTNNGRSRYDGLQAQYRRHLATALDATASYTWSHSLDNDSSDAFLVWAGPGAGPSVDHASSDFDVRQAFTATLAYTAPARVSATHWARWLGGWNWSATFRARSGFPVTVLESEEYNGIAFSNAFRPDYLLGQPLWLSDANSPGGRRLNAAAFFAPAAGVQGTLGRNSIAGFGMWQLNTAVSRPWRLNDKCSLEVRADAFNLFNHPNLGDPLRYLDSPLFGQSVSMLNMALGTGTPGSGLSPVLGEGGPRAVELGVRLRF